MTLLKYPYRRVFVLARGFPLSIFCHLLSQVLAGDLEEAICTHALYYSIWRRYEAMPERFDWNHKAPNVHFYPLRPELVESTYLLYQVSRAMFYMYLTHKKISGPCIHYLLLSDTIILFVHNMYYISP